MIRIKTQKKLSQAQKKGQTINLFGTSEYKKDIINTFGNSYKKDLMNQIYFLFTKDDNGNQIFNIKQQAKNIELNKNPKSFYKERILRAINKEDKKKHNLENTIGYKTYKEKINYKDINNKINILIRGDNEDIIKETSKNTYYNIRYIDLTMYIIPYEGEIELIRYKTLTSNYINGWKQKYNKNANLGLKPAEINELISGFIYGDEFTDAYLHPFPNPQLTGLQTTIQVFDTNTGQNLTQKLKTDGNNYYLFNDVRNFTDMTKYFNSVEISIKEGENCVIETLKYIYNNSLRKGNNRKTFKKELEKMEKKYIDNNEIPSYKLLVEFFELTKTNYKIFNYTDKNDNNQNTFKPKEKIYNFIVYNKHLYFIDNDKNFDDFKNCLETNDKYLIVNENKFNREFNKLLLNDKQRPKIIKFNKNENYKAEILSFEDYNNNVFVKDDENETNSKLLYLCQILNIKYNPYITLSNLSDMYFKDNNIKVKKSFFLYNYTPREYIHTEEIEDPENTITFDFNKYYSNILLSLDNIPIINNLCHNVEQFSENEEILNNYVYSIEILNNEYNLFFPNDDIYFGCILNTEYYKTIFRKMLKDKKIKIVDKIKCEWIENYYKPFISKLFKTVEDTENKNNMEKIIKDIINRTVGKFERNKEEQKQINKNIHIEECNEVINYHHNENENYYYYNTNDKKYKLYYDEEIKKNNSYNVLENHKPLRTLIINLSRLNIIKFIIDNNFDDIDILQINTDGITIRNKKTNPQQITKEELDELEEFGDIETIKRLKKIKYNKDDEIYYNGKYNKLIEDIKNNQDKYKLYGVKIQEFKKYNKQIITSNNISFVNDIIKHYNKFVVNLGYAGIGKSYKINNLIQEMTKNNETNILLAPTHKVLKLYPKEINKNTIQYYTTNNKIPEEKNIIIDEFYLINFKDFRYIINLLYTHNKNIYIFGDKFQLPPVDTHSNNYNILLNGDEKPLLNMDFLKSISTEYNEYLETDKNHRNNFNLEVYKEFIKNEYTQQQQNILINHFINNRCDENKPFKIICYRNETKNEINNEYLLKNNQEFYKDDKTKQIIIKGLNIPLIAKKNFKINENLIITSKDEYILNVENNKYILSFENFNKDIIKFELEPDKIFKYFDVAYCLNLYNIQGQTLTNFKFCLDDTYFLNKDNKYNITGGFYTLISRIKEELTDKKISIEDINNIIKNNKITNKKDIKQDITTENTENKNINVNTSKIYKFGKTTEIKPKKIFERKTINYI